MIEFTEQLNIQTGWKKDICPSEKEVENFGYVLYPEQRQILYLMKQLENQEFIQYENKKIYYNKIRFGAPFSFGKTIVSLALIKTKNNPIEHKTSSFFNNTSKLLTCDISELYVHRPKNVDTTLVIISSSIMNQWQIHINKTNLNALIIDTLDDFENLCVKLINNDLNKFDLVLLVYRKLRNNYPLPFGVNNFHWSENSNVTLLSVLSIDKLWKRVMIDDFDTINIFYDMCIPSKMIWLISATNNSIDSKDKNNIYHTNNCFKISAINHRILDVLKDPFIQELTIKTYLNIIIPKIQIYCYTFEYGSTVNQVLNNLNYSPEVCEKINSDDISGAALLLGMSKDCQSMGEFLYLLINKNKNSYKDCLKLCEKIEEFFTLIHNNDHIMIRELPREEGEEIGGEYNCPNFCIRNDKVWGQYIIDLENNNQFITTIEMKMLRILLENCKENAGNFKNILERIKRNMEDGLCGKCYCEVEDDEKFVLQCCNILLCKYCILKHNSRIFIDRCPNCIKKLDKHNLLQLPKKCSLEDFIDLDFEDAFVKLRDFNKTQIDKEDLYSELSPKEQALLNILNNKTPKNCVEKTYNGLDMDGVIESKDIVENDGTGDVSKFIIFTKWQFCANSLSELFKKYNINNLILRGTNTKMINKTLLKFKTDPNFNVLLVASNDICSGLNLQFATHMIFYHSIRSTAVTAQLVGRCQRIGRKQSLKLIALQHKNEGSAFSM